MDPNPPPDAAGFSTGPGGASGRAPPVISDHTLLRCIGRGSYGEVWLARNVIGGYRAVKLVYRDTFRDVRPFERELAGIRKFEPISRSHEGFVDVLHVGADPGGAYFFYVMELGDDLEAGAMFDAAGYAPRTLAKELGKRGRLPFQECLQLGLSLSSALSHLHKQGLVHRDVKPSNILFVGGVPKLADLGLVAGIDEAKSYVGTEGFIPPEGPGTPQADVYGLGKVLYETSTGLDRHDFPELPDNLAEFDEPGAFLELNEVILQACKTRTGERYESAWKMHADLVVLANGHSVRRLRTLERRWSRFKRIGALSVVGLLVAGVIGFEINRNLQIGRELQQRQVGAQLARGTEMMERGDLLGSLAAYAEAFHLDQTKENGPTHRLRLRAILDQSPKLTRIWSGTHPAAEGWFSPDGRQVLIVEDAGRAQVFDAVTGRAASPAFGQGEQLYRACFSGDGRLALTANMNGSACVWDLADGRLKLRIRHPDRVFSARFSAGDERILTACKDGRARIWSVETGRLLLEIAAHSAPILYAAFSPDARLLVTASRDNTAQVWDAGTGQAIGSPLAHGDWVTYATFSPDSRRVVTAGLDHCARVWDAATGRKLLPDLAHPDGLFSVEFSPDGRFVVTACLDGTARIWASDTGQPAPLNPILRHSDRLRHAAFCPDGHRVITSGIDGITRTWDLAGSTLQPQILEGIPSANGDWLIRTNGGLRLTEAASGRSHRVAAAGEVPEWHLSRRGDLLLVRTANGPGRGQVEIRSARDGQRVGGAFSEEGLLQNAVLSDDGQRVAFIADRVVRLHDVTGGSSVASLAHPQVVLGARFGPEHRWLATWSSNLFFLWDGTTGRRHFAAPGATTTIQDAEFSHDGRFVAVCCADVQLTRCAADIWDTATGRRVGQPLPHNDGILSIAFSPDGRRVVTASEDFTAMVWSTATGKPLTPPLRHAHQVQHAVFSSHGQWIATASTDKTARIWDAETGEPITPPLLSTAPLWEAVFLDKDRKLLAGTRQYAAWVWDLNSDGRSPVELRQLATLLDGQRLTESPEAVWLRFQRAFPDDFVCGHDEIRAWHEAQAVVCQKDNDWPALVFHLQHLLNFDPGNDVLAERLDQAQRHLR